jgi:hypothetical protein
MAEFKWNIKQNPRSVFQINNWKQTCLVRKRMKYLMVYYTWCYTFVRQILAGHMAWSGHKVTFILDLGTLLLSVASFTLRLILALQIFLSKFFHCRHLVCTPSLNRFPVTDVWFVDCLATLYLLQGLFASMVVRGSEFRRTGEEGGMLDKPRNTSVNFG